MFQPTYFKQTDTRGMIDFIRKHPLSTIVCQTKEGLSVNHFPVVIIEQDENFFIQGHFAKANDLYKNFLQETEAKAIFLGPESYISPSWYPSKKRDQKAVPTWNYTAVHVSGTLQLNSDYIWLKNQLNLLSNLNEQHFEKPWKVSDAPPEYIDAMLKAIVGFEMKIENITGQSKMSQNHPEENREGVIKGLLSQGKDKVAEWVKNPDMK